MKPTVASYYGEPGRDRFYGRRTASGEPLLYPSPVMPQYPTVAHKTLPFGTLVALRNPETGASITARVNDRGPYIAGREFDLSYAAARQLGMVERGVARLEYRIIGDADDEQPMRHAPRSPVSYAEWTVGEAIAFLVSRRRRSAWDGESWMPDVDVAAEAAREFDLMPPVPLDANAFHGLPVHGRISSRFGPRWGRRHYGLDIAAPWGAPVWATAAGKVIVAGTLRGYGNTVILAHAGGTQTLYAHLSMVNVARDAQVSAGDIVGFCGSSGNSTGPHVHYGVLRNGRFVDPLEVAAP